MSVSAILYWTPCQLIFSHSYFSQIVMAPANIQLFKGNIKAIKLALALHAVYKDLNMVYYGWACAFVRDWDKDCEHNLCMDGTLQYLIQMAEMGLRGCGSCCVVRKWLPGQWGGYDSNAVLCASHVDSYFWGQADGWPCTAAQHFLRSCL